MEKNERHLSFLFGTSRVTNMARYRGLFNLQLFTFYWLFILSLVDKDIVRRPEDSVRYNQRNG
jgi:hypothetical protein